MMRTASVTRVDEHLEIQTPAYNVRFIARLKEVARGCYWERAQRTWIAPLDAETAIRETIRKFWPIEGEPLEYFHLEHEIVRVHVTGKTSAKRSYMGGVQVDGKDLWNTETGLLNLREREAFQILESSGGFTYGDGYLYRGRGHMFGVEFNLVLRVRQGAQFEATGHADHWGAYKILERWTEEEYAALSAVGEQITPTPFLHEEES